MQKLVLTDIQNIIDYERHRDAFRKKIIALKKNRRVTVGEFITLVFENRDTVLFQVQEMTRIERLVEDAQIQVELDAYNQLIPGEHELTATLLVEITDQSKIRDTLDSLIGMHRMVALEIGDEKISAKFDPSQFSDDRISAVQYISFALSPAQWNALCDASIPARIIITHPNYSRAATLSADTRKSLTQS